MGSEYDPIGLPGGGPVDDDLEAVREKFAAAGEPFFSTPYSWLAWGLLLPAAALGTPLLARVGGGRAVLLGWSLMILVGGAVEVGLMRRRQRGPSAIASWVFRVQANLSVVALALSAALFLAGAGRLVPGLWLLVLGHSLYGAGGLAFGPLRTAGLIYQLGGLLALVMSDQALIVFAASAAVGNLWMAWAIWRRRETG